MYSWPVAAAPEDLCSPLSEAGSGVKWGSQAMNVTQNNCTPEYARVPQSTSEYLKAPQSTPELPVFSGESGRRLTTL